MVAEEKILQKFIQVDEFIQKDIEDIRKFQKIIINNYIK